MAAPDFQDRLARIAEKQPQSEQTAGPAPVSGLNSAPAGPKTPRRKNPVLGFLLGALGSVLIMGLFHNMQAISDAAPAFIRESETPGALGLPIAVATIIWIPLTCILFIRTISRGPNGRGEMSFFPIGAFATLARYFGIFKPARGFGAG